MDLAIQFRSPFQGKGLTIHCSELAGLEAGGELTEDRTRVFEAKL
jgi:hypothetical protein